jgi:hypothetical protein
MKRLLICLPVLISLFSSCKKDNTNQTPAPSPSSTGNTYFIEGKVNGVMHHSEYRCQYSGCDMVTGNYDSFMNAIQMQRTTSATSDIGWDIHIDQVTLDSWTIPDTLDASYPSGQPHLDLSYYSGTWQSDNNWLVDGVVLGDNSFNMKVTSKTNDIIEGTFSGQLRNGSNSDTTVTVTEGKFKIKLIRI